MSFVGRHPCASFVALVVLTPYGVTVPLLLAGVSQDHLKPLKLLFALTPLIYVWFVTHATAGEPGVLRLFQKFWRPGVKARWYAAALGTFPLFALTALDIRWAYDGFFPPPSEFASLGMIVVLSPPLLFFPGITEEFAWRGFLQSELQRRLHWWWASVVVGLVWASWHGFDFLLGNWTAAWPWILGYPVYMVGTSIFIGWIYTRGDESVFLAMLAHFGANVVNFFIPIFEENEDSSLPALLYFAGLSLLAVAIGVGEALWRLPRSRDRRASPVNPLD